MKPHSISGDRVTYDDEADVYYLRRPLDSNVSDAIILAIAEISESDPLEMKPLAKFVDLDLLDSIYSAHMSNSISIDGTISIMVDNHQVSIGPDGTIAIQES